MSLGVDHGDGAAIGLCGAMIGATFGGVVMDDGAAIGRAVGGAFFFGDPGISYLEQESVGALNGRC